MISKLHSILARARDRSYLIVAGDFRELDPTVELKKAEKLMGLGKGRKPG